MQNIVLFIEPAQRPPWTPSKIGNLFMNQFSIDEDVNNEILKIYYLENNDFSTKGLGLMISETINGSNFSFD